MYSYMNFDVQLIVGTLMYSYMNFDAQLYRYPLFWTLKLYELKWYFIVAVRSKTWKR